MVAAYYKQDLSFAISILYKNVMALCYIYTFVIVLVLIFFSSTLMRL